MCQYMSQLLIMLYVVEILPDTISMTEEFLVYNEIFNFACPH